jgi:hypothetical protein
VKQGGGDEPPPLPKEICVANEPTQLATTDKEQYRLVIWQGQQMIEDEDGVLYYDHPIQRREMGIVEGKDAEVEKKFFIREVK